MSNVMIGAIMTPAERHAREEALKRTQNKSGGTAIESGAKIVDTLSNLFNRQSSGGGVAPYRPEPTEIATGNGFLDSTPFGGQLKMKTVLLFAGLGIGGYFLYKKMK